jgi:putative membrane protein
MSILSMGIKTNKFPLKTHHATPQATSRDRYTDEESHSAEIIGIALLIIGLISFIGIILKSLNF